VKVLKLSCGSRYGRVGVVSVISVMVSSSVVTVILVRVRSMIDSGGFLMVMLKCVVSAGLKLMVVRVSPTGEITSS
jgi:hypothetical protein